ncbi:MAG: enoyl-CoA hydratase/isomerase family protein [Chloroflexota bacterium]
MSAPVPGLAFAVDGAIATITLDRPDKLNAMTPAMLEGLEALFGTIEADPAIRVVILTGAGDRAFCAGADINAWSSLEPLDMWRSWVRLGHRVVDRLDGLRQPTIAALNGIAYGGGSRAGPGVRSGGCGGHREGCGARDRHRHDPGLGHDDAARRARRTGARQADDPDRPARWRPSAPRRGGAVRGGPRRRAPDRHARPRRSDRAAGQAPVAVQVAKQLVDGLRPRVPASLEALGSGLTAFTDDADEGLASFRERRPPRFGGA